MRFAAEMLRHKALGFLGIWCEALRHGDLNSLQIDRDPMVFCPANNSEYLALGSILGRYVANSVP